MLGSSITSHALCIKIHLKAIHGLLPFKRKFVAPIGTYACGQLRDTSHKVFAGTLSSFSKGRPHLKITLSRGFSRKLLRGKGDAVMLCVDIYR